jgi:hypothetical protein
MYLVIFLNCHISDMYLVLYGLHYSEDLLAFVSSNRYIVYTSAPNRIRMEIEHTNFYIYRARKLIILKIAKDFPSGMYT